MQELNNITINRLPVKTWNFLRMNEAKVELVEIDKSSKSSINKGAFDGVIDFKTNINLSDYEELTHIQTGMGSEIESFSSDNDLIIIKENANIDKTLVIKYKYDEDDKSGNRLFFIAEPNSKLNVIVVFESQAANCGTSVHEIRAIIRDNASLNIYTANLLGENFSTFHNCGAVCKDKAAFSLIQVIGATAKTYYGGYTLLQGKKSSFVSDIAYYANKSQILDMNYVAKHTGKKTMCDISAVGVLDDDAKKIFRGTIDFVRGCSGAKGNEKEDVLLLSENNVNQTIPLILCDEEDVEGNHGATIGKIDEEVMFYLASRGISKEEAERMMAKARIKAVCDSFPSDEIKEQITKFMEDRI